MNDTVNSSKQTSVLLKSQCWEGLGWGQCPVGSWERKLFFSCFLWGRFQPGWPSWSSKGQMDSCSSGKGGDAEGKEEPAIKNSAAYTKLCKTMPLSFSAGFKAPPRGRVVTSGWEQDYWRTALVPQDLMGPRALYWMKRPIPNGGMLNDSNYMTFSG